MGHGFDVTLGVTVVAHVVNLVSQISTFWNAPVGKLCALIADRICYPTIVIYIYIYIHIHELRK